MGKLICQISEMVAIIQPLLWNRKAWFLVLPIPCNEYLDRDGKIIGGRNNTSDAKLSITTRCNKILITESSSKDGRIKESELKNLAEEN